MMRDDFMPLSIGTQEITVNYRPDRLVELPFHISTAAVCQREAAWMTAYLANTAREDLLEVIVVNYSGREITLREYLSHENEVSVRCCSVNGEIAQWHGKLKCEECDGDGQTYTNKGRPIPCPCCGESGTAVEFHWQSNMVGRFVGWGDPAVNVKFGSFSEPIAALPLNQALDVIAWWLL